jgi:hypothetical protein
VDIDIVGGQRLGHGAGMGYDELDWRFFSGCGINSLFSAMLPVWVLEDGSLCRRGSLCICK